MIAGLLVGALIVVGWFAASLLAVAAWIGICELRFYIERRRGAR